ncbi:hypothetical protein DACRYDRAFT_20844 [Dacryopinax primogenitus]|uniref:Uncharacterized protein n=1 Tax=Dacryopinax primogenitus (strain DJM 731) TaxID=1858805 RepID=M5G6E2_DACPD|nr:uncharacterized protein DACRYDRAFT_20844 [Dacryopinax primogenitus]EJU04259.1 hypothetical protein DACRYDRAFT_20844 [Dacryopinax primogenitus]
MDAGPSTSTRVTVSTKPKPEPRSEPKSEPKPKTKPETIVDPKPRPATDVAPSAVSEHPLPSSPPTEDQLLIKSLRKYSRYVEAYAKIVQQKQIYEDVAAGRRPLDDPKLYSPEQMEPIVRDYQRQHTAIQALYDKMDEMRAAAASSSTPSVGSKP